MDGAKRARSGKPRIRPSVDLHHPRLLPTRLHATRCWLGGGAPRGHAAHATARRGAGDLQFREELRIPCADDLLLDSVVVGAARAMAHVAIRPWSSRPAWSTKPSWKRREISRSAGASRRLHNVGRLSSDGFREKLQRTQLRRAASRMSDVAAARRARVRWPQGTRSVPRRTRPTAP